MNIPVETLKSIGPQKKVKLEKLGISTVGDLIRHFPRDYEDRSKMEKIAEVELNTPVLVCGRIEARVKGNYIRGKKSTFKLLVRDDTGSVEVIFFNMNYGEQIFQIDEEVVLYGRITENHGKRQMVHPDFSKNEKTATGILPIYPLTAGISTGELRKWMRSGFAYLSSFEESMPSATMTRNRLCDGIFALENIHFPKDYESLKIARYRLVFEELMMLQTGLLMIKNQLQEGKTGLVFDASIKIEEFVKTIPFALTGAQLRTIDEIEKDMLSGKIMNRLVQGDVGSGKTIVAAAAIYKCIKSGYQAVMMAPTEILARQHYEGLSQTFAIGDGSKRAGSHLEPSPKAPHKVGFLSGSLSAKDKRQVLADLEAGNIDLLIGTHAVIQEHVTFKNLGLVVTDEQHRFGVNQRAVLAEKGNNPHMLVMTATPIPRTLALILYGDLDISLIDEMPPGRKEIITYSTSATKRKRAYDFVAKEIDQGRQAYVVTPLIEDSEAESMADVKSVQTIYEDLLCLYPKYNIALLHGEMKQKEKDHIMERFKNGEIHILVATVVIEVGINVPNASVMVIENAERFGLAQMHQLRGRVGRGEYQSYCILISELKTEVAKERADIMKESADGFVIAEKDLELRGPGEFFGTRQHGVPELKIANLIKHMKILKMVQVEANILLKEDPLLQKPEHKKLLTSMKEMFKNAEKFNL